MRFHPRGPRGWSGSALRAAPDRSREQRRESYEKTRLERERRPYRAHLTIGRLRTPERIPLERVTAPEGAAFPVDEVVLFESRISSTGSRYRPLARLPLGQADVLEFAPSD